MFDKNAREDKPLFESIFGVDPFGIERAAAAKEERKSADADLMRWAIETVDAGHKFNTTEALIAEAKKLFDAVRNAGK